jgi:hypothetical protein
MPAFGAVDDSSTRLMPPAYMRPYVKRRGMMLKLGNISKQGADSLAGALAVIPTPLLVSGATIKKPGV